MMFRIVAPCLVALMALRTEAAPTPCADAALVFAIDASGSITAGDFHLQTAGHFLALHHPDVLAAFSAVGTVDLAAVFWGDSAYPPRVVPWQRVDTAEDARQFARRLVATPRTISGDTDIGSGLTAALDLIAGSDRCARRVVIDLSGNGRATPLSRISRGIPVSIARARAEEMGVTVNALAITTEDAGLAEYYHRQVKTGFGAFVVEADSLDAYPEALARKLARELLSAVEGPTGG